MKNTQRSRESSQAVVVPNNVPKSSFRRLALAGAIAATSFNAQAFELDLSSLQDATLTVDSIVTYGLQWRVEERDPTLSQGSNGAGGQLDSFPGVVDNAFILNGNDGNNSFDRGLTSNRFAIVTDLDFNAGDWGVFLRAKAYYDAIYADGTSDMSDAGYASYNANPRFHANGGYTAQQGQFNPRAVDYLSQNGRLLDAFFYTSFDLTDNNSLTLRLGRQVISWGEGLMTGNNLSTSINRLDAQVRNTPGLEIKELFLPTESIFAQVNLADWWSMEAYYQFNWEPNILDPNSSYMSEFDSFGAGGDTFIFVTGTEDRILGKDFTDPNNPLHAYLPKPGCQAGEKCGVLAPYLVETQVPKDYGQFGIANQFFLNNGDEIGVYFVNYHEKIPNFILPLDSANDYGHMLQLLVAAPGFGDPNNACKREIKGDVNSPCRVDDNGDPLPIYEDISDLNDELNTTQYITLLDFFQALPEKGGTIAEIFYNFLDARYPQLGLTEEIVHDILSGISNLPLPPEFAALGQLNPDDYIRSLNYRKSYAENVRMYGLTYSTVIGSANVAGEVTYRENTPLLSGTVARTPVRGEMVQLNINSIFVFEPTWLWDFSSLTAEVATWWLPGKKPFNPNDYDNPDRVAVQNTPKGFGYAFLWTWEYRAVAPGLDLLVPIYVNHGVDGSMFTSNFRDGQVTTAIGISAKYQEALEASLSYMANFGDKDDVFQRLISDRDNISLAFKYSF